MLYILLVGWWERQRKPVVRILVSFFWNKWKKWSGDGNRLIQLYLEIVNGVCNVCQSWCLPSSSSWGWGYAVGVFVVSCQRRRSRCVCNNCTRLSASTTISVITADCSTDSSWKALECHWRRHCGSGSRNSRELWMVIRWSCLCVCKTGPVLVNKTNALKKCTLSTSLAAMWLVYLGRLCNLHSLLWLVR